MARRRRPTGSTTTRVCSAPLAINRDVTVATAGDMEELLLKIPTAGHTGFRADDDAVTDRRDWRCSRRGRRRRGGTARRPRLRSKATPSPTTSCTARGSQARGFPPWNLLLFHRRRNNERRRRSWLPPRLRQQARHRPLPALVRERQGQRRRRVPVRSGRRWPTSSRRSHKARKTSRAA